MSFAIAIIGLLLLILVHEAGHFVIAKAVGAKATKFYLGFPPAIAHVQRGETEYGVGAIPLGGYVRIVGMTRPQAVDLWRVVDAADEAKLRRDFDRPDLLTESVERLRHLLTAGRVEDARLAVAPVLAALETDRDLLVDKTYEQAAKDLAKMEEELDRRAYWALSVSRRIAIILAGPMANVLAALAIFIVFFMYGEPTYAPAVGSVVVASPAAQAGLKPGDRVLAVGTTATPHIEDLAPAIQAAKGDPVSIVVERDGKRLTLGPLAARYSAKDGRYLVGIGVTGVQAGTHRSGPVAATRRAFSESWAVTTGTFSALAHIFTPQGSKNISSTVGIVQVSSDAVDGGYYPHILALISLSLAIFNLLPFLPLDGGHILFALLEKVRGGRPIPRAVFERVSMIGIVLVLAVFALGLNNDITRMMGG
jgi:regulator of sigma E protease